MTQHSDEPSVDELLKLCDEALADQPEGGPYFREEKLARALRSRLSHPTLSADRLAEELAETQKALRDAEKRGWNDGLTYAAACCDFVADSRAHSASPMISGQHDGARECARAIRALKQ